MDDLSSHRGAVPGLSGLVILVLLASGGCGARSGLLLPASDREESTTPAEREPGDPRTPSQTVEPAAGDVAPVPVLVPAPETPVPIPVPALPVECEMVDPVVRVLSDDEVLYELDPLSLAVEEIGGVDCGEELNSMSIASDGGVYVASQGGGLFRVSADTHTCTETVFDRSSLAGDKFSMGFATGPDGLEALYIIEQLASAATSETDAFRLSVINTGSLALEPIGVLSPALPPTEITGTGDGRLFGFAIPWDDQPGRLVEIDPITAEVDTLTELAFGDPGMPTSFAFDFAFWGGSFYLFLSVGNQVGSSVIRLDPSVFVSEYLGEVGIRIIGAGTSICAAR